MNGKGSKPRPYSIPLEAYGNEYERIFRTGSLRKPHRDAQCACDPAGGKPAINGRRRLYAKTARA